MFFTANKKGVRLEDLPPEAWPIIQGIQGNDSGSSIDMLYSKIAWLVSIAGAILLGG